MVRGPRFFCCVGQAVPCMLTFSSCSFYSSHSLQYSISPLLFLSAPTLSHRPWPCPPPTPPPPSSSSASSSPFSSLLSVALQVLEGKLLITQASSHCARTSQLLRLRWQGVE